MVTAFREEMARALESGFTEEEVMAAKRSFLDSAQNSRTNDAAVAAQLSANLFFQRSMAFVEAQERAIGRLTPEDIHAALKRHIDLAKVSVFRAGDFANKLVE